MAIVQTLVTSAKQNALTAITTGTLKMALYTADANLDQGTAVYTTANEVVGGGYTAGGQVLTNVTVNVSDSVAYLSFDNVVWTPASFTARAALIYNASNADAALAVLDFGSDKTATTSFTVQMPANTVTSALIRFA